MKAGNNPLGVAGFVDVETTGLSPAYDEIIELAICLFEFNWDTGEIIRITDHYTGLREPVKPISQGAARVHGISLHDVKGKKLDHNRIEKMLHTTDFLVSHNASFDRGFVTRLFDKCSQKPWLCSMRGVDWRKRGFGSMGLQNLLKAHGINVSRAHRAEDDVRGAIRLLSHFCKDGRTYFAELLEKYPGHLR